MSVFCGGLALGWGPGGARRSGRVRCADRQFCGRHRWRWHRRVPRCRRSCCCPRRISRAPTSCYSRRRASRTSMGRTRGRTPHTLVCVIVHSGPLFCEFISLVNSRIPYQLHRKAPSGNTFHSLRSAKYPTCCITSPIARMQYDYFPCTLSRVYGASSLSSCALSN